MSTSIGDDAGEQENSNDQAAELAELCAKHGTQRLAFWRVAGVRVVVAIKGNHKQKYRKLQRDLRESKLDADAQLDAFGLSFVVEPEFEQARTIFDDYPAFGQKVALCVQGMLGGDVEELGKGSA